MYIVCCFQWFHDFMTKEDILPRTLSNVLFSNVNPIYDFHCSFLKEIEQRLALWLVNIYLSYFLITNCMLTYLNFYFR